MGSCTTTLQKESARNVLKSFTRSKSIIAQSNAISYDDPKFTFKLGIFGYIRLYSHILIPVDVIVQIIAYTESLVVCNWNIHKILSCNIDEKLKTEPIIIHNKNCKISLICSLSKKKDCMHLLISAGNAIATNDSSLNPCQVKSVDLYLDISCPATNYYKKRQYIYKFNKKNSFIHSLSLRYFQPKRLKKYSTGNSIQIYFDIEIIKIINIQNDVIFHKQLYLKRIIKKFEWKIDGDMFHEMKIASLNQRFYSDNFDEINKNWCLTFIPCDKHGNSNLYLYLLKMPQSMDSVVIIYDIKCYFNKTITQSKRLSNSAKKFKRDQVGYGGVIIKASDLYLKDCLRFCVMLQIQEIYKYDTNKLEVYVPPCDWTEYGIIHTDINGKCIDY